MIDNRENNIWTVYVHIVPKAITKYDYDKYYVGITSKPINERWRKNGNGYRGQPFYNAIKKYGWNNIEHHIIAKNLIENEAKDFEKILINKLKCNLYKYKYGYNMTDGGDGTLGHNMSKEEKEKRRKKYSGKGNPYYGKKHTKETKRKISKHHADVSGINNPNSKKVYQFTLDGKYINQYDSCSTAAKALGYKNGSSKISHAALSHGTSVKFLWEYENNIIINNGNIEIKNFLYKPFKTNKRVFGFNKDTKELVYDFESCVIAAQALNIEKGNISGCACYKYKTVKKYNYLWRYEKDVGFDKNGKAYFIE